MGRLEEMLRSSRPARAPSEGLHARVMAGVTGEPGSERVGGSRGRVVAPAVVGGLLVVVVVGLVVVRGGQPRAEEVAVGSPIDAERAGERLVVIQSAMTRPLMEEANLLAADAKRVVEGLRSRLPLM